MSDPFGKISGECTCPALNGQPHVCDVPLMANECSECLGPNGHLPLCPKNTSVVHQSPLSSTNGQADKVDKGGRPKGYDGRKSKMPSAMAQAFKRAGLDWQVDFAVAIKRASDYNLTKAERNEARDRIALWLRLLPYLITSSARSSGKKWKGKPSRAALIALEALEGKND